MALGDSWLNSFFPAKQSQQATTGGNIFTSLGQSPLFMGGLSMLAGQGPGAGAQIAQATQQGRMQQADWEQQQAQRQRMTDAWGRVFPNGAAAADHPLLKGVPPEITSLAQTMGPEEGLGFLGRYALSRKGPEVKEVKGRLVRVSPDGTAQQIYSAVDDGGVFDDPEKRVNAETTVRKEYAQLAKPYFEVRDAFSRVQQAAANPSPAGDLALIFNYMKMLDPGSVVREGEFATAQNAAGIPARVVNLYNRLLSGERLNPDQRSDFVGQAQGLFGRQEQQYQVIQNQYRGIAERSGLDPRNTILDFTIPQGAAGRAGGPPAQSEVSSVAGGGMPPRDGPQGQIPPRAVQLLRFNPSPDVIRQFEEKYGPGSAQQFLMRR